MSKATKIPNPKMSKVTKLLQNVQSYKMSKETKQPKFSKIVKMIFGYFQKRGFKAGHNKMLSPSLKFLGGGECKKNMRIYAQTIKN